ncbi:hypothetical protein RI367_001006 [Sorochytrium milnesiophthora]
MAYPMSTHATKWAVFVVSLLTSLAGIVLIILGIYSLNDATSLLASRTIPIVMMVVGSLVFLISFLGCFGTVTESRSILTVFFSCLLALVLVQVVFAVLALANKGNYENYLEDQWQGAYDKHPRVIRDIQEEYACCGFRFTTDRAYPKSSSDACLKSSEFGYQISCYRELSRRYRSSQTTLGVGAIAIAAVQLLSLLFTFMLIRMLPTAEQQERDLLAEHRRLLNESRGGAGSAAGYQQDAYYGSGGPSFPPRGEYPPNSTSQATLAASTGKGSH